MPMLGNNPRHTHNVGMTSDEQILGVLQVIDRAKAVTMTAIPVTIERDRFSDYPDYEPILEKLEWDFDAISINQYPKIDDVDYHASVGFVDESILKNDYSYKLTIKPKFDELLKQYQAISNSVDSKVTVLTLNGPTIVAILPDGAKVEIKKLRTDSGTYNFMKYMFMNQGKYVPISVIQTEVDGCQSRKDLTELVRNCGFSRELKGHFFNGTTKYKVHFNSRASIPRDIVAKAQD